MDTSVPLNYYTVFKHIQDVIPKGKHIIDTYLQRFRKIILHYLYISTFFSYVQTALFVPRELIRWTLDEPFF